MADRTIKPDSGNDLVLQNNGGGTKIEIPNSGNIAITGTIGSGTIGSSVIFPAGGTGNPISVAVIADEKSASTNSQTLNTSFTTRELNTELSDADGIVSISSNQFTLGAGTYLITWSAPAYKVNRHITQLYDVTSTNVLPEGQTAFSGAATDEQQTSTGAAVHTITTNNVYEIQHIVQTARTTDGGGIALGGTGGGANNIFTYVTIYKLK